MATDHQSSHISNVCRFCNLYSNYWHLLTPCPARKQGEAAIETAKQKTEYMIRTIGADDRWHVIDTKTTKRAAIKRACELSVNVGQNYHVAISTKSGDRILFRAHRGMECPLMPQVI